MILSVRSQGGYTLVESLVAVALFLTVVIGVMNTMGGLIGSPRTKLLQAALVLAEDEVAQVSSDNLASETVVSGKLLVKRTVVLRGLYAEVTFAVSAMDDETRDILTVTKFVLLKNEE